MEAIISPSDVKAEKKYYWCVKWKKKKKKKEIEKEMKRFLCDEIV